VQPAGAQSLVDVPLQKVLLPVIVQEGSAVNVTVFEQVLVHPAALVIVTE